MFFLNTLESILKKIYTNSLNIIIGGDININYLDDDDTNKQNLIPY
jgi:exonuclease III